MKPTAFRIDSTTIASSQQSRPGRRARDLHHEHPEGLIALVDPAVAGSLAGLSDQVVLLDLCAPRRRLDGSCSRT